MPFAVRCFLTNAITQRAAMQICAAPPIVVFAAQSSKMHLALFAGRRPEETSATIQIEYRLA